MDWSELCEEMMADLGQRGVLYCGLAAGHEGAHVSYQELEAQEREQPLRDRIVALEADKVALLEALEAAAFWVHMNHNSKWLGGVDPPRFAPPRWQDCPSSPCQRIQALLSRFRSEGAEVKAARPKTCMHCFIEDPVACVYKGEAFCGLGAEVKAGE